MNKIQIKQNLEASQFEKDANEAELFHRDSNDDRDDQQLSEVVKKDDEDSLNEVSFTIPCNITQRLMEEIIQRKVQKGEYVRKAMPPVPKSFHFGSGVPTESPPVHGIPTINHVDLNAIGTHIPEEYFSASASKYLQKLAQLEKQYHERKQRVKGGNLKKKKELQKAVPSSIETLKVSVPLQSHSASSSNHSASSSNRPVSSSNRSASLTIVPHSTYTSHERNVISPTSTRAYTGWITDHWDRFPNLMDVVLTTAAVSQDNGSRSSSTTTDVSNGIISSKTPLVSTLKDSRSLPTHPRNSTSVKARRLSPASPFSQLITSNNDFYSKRLLVLLTFSFCLAVNSAICFTFVGIPNPLASVYNLTLPIYRFVQIFLLMFGIFCIPLYIVSQWVGVICVARVATCCQCIACIIRSLFYEFPNDLFVGQLIAATASVPTVNSIIFISNDWFPKSKRASASIILIMSLLIGILIIFLLSITIESEHHIPYLLHIVTAMSGFSSLLCLYFFRFSSTQQFEFRYTSDAPDTFFRMDMENSSAISNVEAWVDNEQQKELDEKKMVQLNEDDETSANTSTSIETLVAYLQHYVHGKTEGILLTLLFFNWTTDCFGLVIMMVKPLRSSAFLWPFGCFVYVESLCISFMTFLTIILEHHEFIHSTECFIGCGFIITCLLGVYIAYRIVELAEINKTILVLSFIGLSLCSFGLTVTQDETVMISSVICVGLFIGLIAMVSLKVSFDLAIMHDQNFTILFLVACGTTLSGVTLSLFGYFILSSHFGLGLCLLNLLIASIICIFFHPTYPRLLSYQYAPDRNAPLMYDESSFT